MKNAARLIRPGGQVTDEENESKIPISETYGPCKKDTLDYGLF